MTGSGTEKRVIAGRRRDELSHHRIAFVAHRDECDNPRIFRRNNSFRLLRVFVHRLHLIGIHQDPIVTRAQELARMMEFKANLGAGGARQLVGFERQEIAIRLDIKIDYFLSGSPLGSAS